MKHLLPFLFLLPCLSPAQSLDWQIQDDEYTTGDWDQAAHKRMNRCIKKGIQDSEKYLTSIKK